MAFDKISESLDTILSPALIPCSEVNQVIKDALTICFTQENEAILALTILLIDSNKRHFSRLTDIETKMDSLVSAMPSKEVSIAAVSSSVRPPHTHQQSYSGAATGPPLSLSAHA